MRLIVEPEIFTSFPGIRIAVAVAQGIDNTAVNPQVEARWHEAWQRAGEAGRAYGNAQSHPRVRPWRERMRALGVSKEFPSSVEALLRRALKGGEPFTINPVVDFYNAVSLRHTVPAGGFDLAHVVGDLEVRLTRPGERFQAMDADEAIPVAAGEVAYVDAESVLTRHFIWRQARRALIGPETSHVVLVSEVLGEVGGHVAEAVLEDVCSGLRELFGVSPKSAGTIEATSPELDL